MCVCSLRRGGGFGDCVGSRIKRLLEFVLARSGWDREESQKQEEADQLPSDSHARASGPSSQFAADSAHNVDESSRDDDHFFRSPSGQMRLDAFGLDCQGFNFFV